MRLTSGIIKNSIPRDKKYTLSDGNGLQLTIKPNGKMIWEIRFYFNSKPKTTTLGSYPLVTLKEARKKCDNFKRYLQDGINPIDEKRNQKERISQRIHTEEMKRVNTFEKVARDFITSIEAEYTSRYVPIMLSRLQNHVFAFIGHKSISDISRIHVIECLDRLRENGKIETSERILSAINQIYKYAVTREIVERNIINDIDKRYAIQRKMVRNFPTITDPKKVGEFMRSVDNYHGDIIIKLALKLSIYSAQRPLTIRFACWEEFDMDKKEWIIPASKMKMKREHFVPITNQIRELLEVLAHHTKSKSKYLFPSFTSNVRPISENTLNQALRRMSYTKEELVSHGLRAMFSTIANENISIHGYHSSVIERQLAHAEENKVRGAYNRAEYYFDRFGLSQWYCDYLDTLKSEV